MSISMKKQTNVVRRGSIYYYRARYPSDLVAHFGKVEFSISLETKNVREANSKANIQQLKYDQEFSEIRARLSQSNEQSGMGLERIALLWSSRQIDEDRHSFLDIHTHKVDNPYIAPNPDDSMQHLIEYWQSQGSKAPRTIEEASRVVSSFSAMTENKPASTVTKRDVVRYKDTLLTEGNAPATAIKKINLLKAIFQTALDNDKLIINPATGVKVPKDDTKTKPRIPFSKEELDNIFKSSIYTQGERPRAGAGEASFWIPLLALWTGARLEELGQLHVADIQEEAGIKFIHITNDGGSKNIKTSSSKRKIPIHPELIKYGFMTYVSNIKQTGYIRLFPLIKSPDDRQKTAMFSKWFGRHLRETLKIEDTRKVFHSFRHGFKDACRLSGVLSEHHDRLTGHSKGSIGDNYGSEYYPLKPLNEAMMTLSYNGLDLSHLHIQ